MAELEEKLNAILSDPEAMGQIASIARALTGGGMPSLIRSPPRRRRPHPLSSMSRWNRSRPAERQSLAERHLWTGPLFWGPFGASPAGIPAPEAAPPLSAGRPGPGPGPEGAAALLRIQRRR